MSGSESSYTAEFLEKIRSFAMLAYSIEKIIDLLDPDSPEQLRIDFDTPGNAVCKTYRQGKTTGEYALAKDLFDKAQAHDTGANISLTDRMQAQRVNDIIYKNFGL
ncbi:MAG: hypothetical protein LBK58_11855 [Prevotellaceae bacterium]|jgi:hypothetical protein|nr:hypothetical protein [Prevotellaceae bacterium]